MSHRPGSNRRRRPARNRHATRDFEALTRWLSAGAVAAGLGVAAATGGGVAHADETPPADPPTSESPADPGNDITTPASPFAGLAGLRESLGASRESDYHGPWLREALTDARTTRKPSTEANAPAGFTTREHLARGRSHSAEAKDTSAAISPRGQRGSSEITRSDPPADPSDAVATLRLTADPAEPRITIAGPRRGPEFPAQLSEPVSLRAVVGDLFRWTRLGTLDAGAPVPSVPLPRPLEIIWIGLRRNEYRLFNDYPVAKPVQTGQNVDTGVVRGTVGATDRDGDRLTYTVVDPPTNGDLELESDGTYTYTPSNSLAHTGGVDSFTVVVDDAPGNPWHIHGLADLLGFTRPTTVTVQVVVPKVVNQKPSAPATIVGPPPDSDGVVTGAVNALDANGDPLTYAVATVPVNGSVTLDGNTYTYKPTEAARHDAAADGAGPAATTDTFTISSTDGYGGVTLTTVTVIVKPANVAPSAEPVVSLTPAGSSKVLISFSSNATGTTSTYVTRGIVAITPNTHDGDTEDTVKVTATNSNSALGSVIIDAAGTIVYTPSLGALRQIGLGTAPALTDVVTLTLDDGHGGVTTQDVPIKITDYAFWSLEGTSSFAIPIAPGATQVDISGLNAPTDVLPILNLGVLQRDVNGNLIMTINGVDYPLGAIADVQSLQVKEECQGGTKRTSVSVYAQSSLASFVDLTGSECTA